MLDLSRRTSRLVLGAILAGLALPAMPALPPGSRARAALDVTTPRPAPVARGLPAIVFVSRRPLAEAGAIPGLGPRHRAAAAGGRLLVREPRGALRELLPEGRLFDVSDPAVSIDARRIAFAGTVGPDSGWRIYEVGLDGGGLRTLTDGGSGDDLDPCWLDAHTLVFASTRGGWRSQYDGSPVPQIWKLDLASGALVRLTTERNGADEPAIDPVSGDVVYSRWWYNRWRAGARADSTAALDAAHALPGDHANLWQAIAMRPDGSDAHVLAASFRDRRGESLTQVTVGLDGGVLGVVADELGLSPRPGATEVVWFPEPFGAPVHVAGARFERENAPRYGSARGLASPAACAPAALPDGRIVVAVDRGGRGDFGLWLMARDGRHAVTLVNLPGTLELDPAPVVVRPPPRPREPSLAERWEARRRAAAPRTPTDTFRFFNRDVLEGSYGPRVTALRRGLEGLRIRFWAEHPADTPGGGDSLQLVRETPVPRNGRVDQRGLPAGVPMFEQLVDDAGVVLMTSRGPAHVAGFNAGFAGSEARCIGCHRGHSTAR